MCVCKIRFHLVCAVAIAKLVSLCMWNKFILRHFMFIILVLLRFIKESPTLASPRLNGIKASVQRTAGDGDIFLLIDAGKIESFYK